MENGSRSKLKLTHKVDAIQKVASNSLCQKQFWPDLLVATVLKESTFLSSGQGVYCPVDDGLQ